MTGCFELCFYVSAGSSPEALGILSDLLGSFLSNFTRFLKMNVNHSSADKGCLGFRDALERSLQQVGMGGRDGLCRYWQTAVLGQARRLEMEADEYRNTYLRMTVRWKDAVVGALTLFCVFSCLLG